MQHSLHRDPKGNIEWVTMDVPEHQSPNHGATRRTFYGRLMSDQVEAEEAAVVALQFLCSCYGFGINECYYREAQSQMTGARQAERRLRTLEIQEIHATGFQKCCLSKCKIQTP